MLSLDLDHPAIVSLRAPAEPGGRPLTVFAGTYGGALMVIAALPFPMRDRAVIEAIAVESRGADDRREAA